MIDILVGDVVDQQVDAFARREWKFADKEYFGKEVNWEKKKVVLKAIENNEIVGILELMIQAGVMHIEVIITKHELYEKGIGKSP